MKKFLVCAGACLIIPINNANAVANCCSGCPELAGQPLTYAAKCTDSSFCNGCAGTITSTVINGVCTPTCNKFGGGGLDPIDPIVNTCSQNQYALTVGKRKTCHDCPDGGTTQFLGGGSAIIDCYLPKGTTKTDSTGTYTYTADCYYTK